MKFRVHRINDRIGAKRRNDPALPARCSKFPMMSEGVERVIGRGENFDIEAVEKSTRSVFRINQTARDLIIDRVSRLGAKRRVYTQRRAENIFHPNSAGRPKKEMPVVGESTEDGAGVGSGSQRRNAQLIKLHALRLEHPKHVVIGDDK